VRAVVDTNVIISALISPAGPPGQIIATWRLGRIIVVTSEAMLAELREAVHYPRVRRRIPMSDDELVTVLDDLTSAATVLDEPGHMAVLIRDPDDAIFVEAAIAGEADYIVTGDRDLLELGSYEGIRIVTPAEFVALLPR
jgi:hypothetical protein